MKLYKTIGSHKIFYTALRNTENLTDVKLTLIKHDGTVLLNDVYMSELGDGVYEYTYNFTNDGWYLGTAYSESLGNKTTESIRVGNPLNDYIYGTCNYTDSTVEYEINYLNGTNVKSGLMQRIADTNIWWVDVTGLSPGKYFFKMNSIDTARFDYPFKTEIHPEQLKLVLEPGFNISAYSGSGNYIFDTTSNTWLYISDDVTNTKAGDLFRYIKHFYPAANVKYIKSYYEHPIQRFKVYIPYVTPDSNDNNFPLVQLNQEMDPEKNAFYIFIDSTENIIVNCR